MKTGSRAASRPSGIPAPRCSTTRACRWCRSPRQGRVAVRRDGKRYLDAISSWWVNLFGHANPRINAALKDQLDKLEHAMLAGFTHEPVIELVGATGALAPASARPRFYASDGASAVEIALKMSFHSWRNRGQADKREFVCLKGSYHGETVGALAVTDVALFRDAYGPLLQQAHVVASPDARNAHEGETRGRCRAPRRATLRSAAARTRRRRSPP